MSTTFSRALHALTRAAIALGLSSVMALSAQTATASTIPEATWSVRPASTDAQPSRDNFTLQAAPGATVTDALTVTNYGDDGITLSVYAADAFTTDSGQLDVLPRAETSSQLGAWISVQEDELTLTAGETTDVPFSFTVPPNATPGDYSAGIVTSLTSSADGSVSIDRRLGIRIQLRVEGPLHPQLSIVDAQLHYTGSWNPFSAGSATATYTIRNGGNTRSAANQRLTVTGPFGLAPVEATSLQPIPELLPGEEWTITQDAGDVLPLLWATANVGLAPVAPPGLDSSVVADATTVSFGAWAVPWAQLVLLALIAVMVTRAVLVRRRRHHKEQARIEAAVAEALEHAGR